MIVKPFEGPGSTPSRRRFWDAARNAVMSAQKVAGRFVTIDEHPGKGSVINVADSSTRRGGGGPTPPTTGACCTAGACAIETEAACIAGGGNYLGDGRTCEGIDCTQGACCTDGICSILSEAACISGGGTYHGDGTVCADVDCTQGACCHPDGSCDIETLTDCAAAGGAYQGNGTICGDVDCSHTGGCCRGDICDIETSAQCAVGGGIYMGDGSICSPNPCPPITCPTCAFFCNGHYYLTRTWVGNGTAHYQPIPGTDYNEWTFSSTKTDHCNEDGTITCECDGDGSENFNGGDPFQFYTAECDCDTFEGGFFTEVGGCCWAPAGGTQPENADCTGGGTFDSDCNGVSVDCTNADGFWHYTGTATIVYSDPCVPL